MMNHYNEGTRPTAGDAGPIDFRAVYVVAKVAAHPPCRSLFAHLIVACPRRHRPARPPPSLNWPPPAKKLCRENARVGHRHPCQDQKWRYQGVYFFLILQFT